MEIFQGTARLVTLAEDPIAITEQQMASLRELSLAPTPIKQRNLQLLLEVLNLETDCRLGDVKTVCGLLEAPLTDDRSQNAQLIKRERKISHAGPPALCKAQTLEANRPRDRISAPRSLGVMNGQHSSVVMLILLMLFALIHSGGAALRSRAELVIGARAWRLVFATASIPSAVVVIGWFLAHRYDGIRLWNLQGAPGMVPLVWIGTTVSFLFLYPATYNLLEIPAVLKPQVRLYATGIIRISRHPQAVGQILWCITHALWIGSSFMVVTCIGLIGHHLFAVWHGDQRLKSRFGAAFDDLKATTSVIPFAAVLDGRQKLDWKEFIRPAQLGIAIAVGVFWWAHHFIPSAGEMVRNSALERLLG